uniref:Endoribonuclease Dicer-like n=1 Tax=Diabrotica virgifera virgifera TaxID=50390 RepID=A0A6P7GJE9_DIAVI
MKLSMIFDSVQTTLSFITRKLNKRMEDVSEKEKIYLYSSDQIKQLIRIFNDYQQKKGTDEICCIVFTQRRSTAQILFHILNALSQNYPQYSYIKANFIVGHNSNPYNDTRELLYLHKKNKQILNDFTNKDINVLVSSNVLEEGVDVPKCSLVIKYDCPMDYRSYVQSKGRARHKESLYYVMVEVGTYRSFTQRVNGYKKIEDMLNQYLVGRNDEREEISEEDLQAMYNEDEIPPYFAKPGGACVTMLSAISLLCQYCTSLSSDVYSDAAPEWYKKDSFEDGKVSVVILLPTGSHILDEIQVFMASLLL